MKKYCLCVLLSVLVITAATAQERTKAAISIGPELNIPQRSAYNIGYGVSGKIEVPVISALSLAATVGYHRYSYKTYNIGSAYKPDDDSFIPLKAGVKYYLDPRFYTEGELGTVMKHYTGSNRSYFIYSVGTGYLIPLGQSKSSMIDVGLRFEDWSRNKLQQFAIRVAYRFGF